MEFDTLLNVGMYILILVTLIYVSIVERNDKLCDRPLYPTNCNNVGMAYRGSTPHENSSCEELLDNIRAGAGAERKSIKWRRSLILGIIICFMAWILVITPARLPLWWKFYLTVLIAFAVLYFSFNNYSYHLFKIPEENIYKATDLLESKCIL